MALKPIDQKKTLKTKIYSWKPIFSWDLIRKDISESFQTRKGIFLSGSIWFLALGVLLVAFLISNVLQEPGRDFIRAFLGVIGFSVFYILFYCWSSRGWFGKIL